jgi:hypothetical protein
MDIVIGDHEYFLREYSAHLDDEDIDVINGRLAINFQNCGWTRGDYTWNRDQYNVREAANS